MELGFEKRYDSCRAEKIMEATIRAEEAMQVEDEEDQHDDMGEGNDGEAMDDEDA